MDRISPLFALLALLLAGCGLSGEAGYQAGYAARLAGDDDKAFEHYLDAARSHDYPEARYQVAGMYLEGRGTRQDTGQAISWLTRVVESGDPRWSPQAHRQLGIIYRGDHGEGYRDRRKAAEHFRLCAGQGNADCAHLLALLTPPSLRVMAASRESAAAGLPVSIDSRSDNQNVRESDVQVWQVTRVDPRRDLALLTLAEPVRELNFTDTMAPFDRVRVGETAHRQFSFAGIIAI